MDVLCAPNRAARSSALNPFFAKRLRRFAAESKTSGRPPIGAEVVLSLRPIKVFTMGPPGQRTMAASVAGVC